ncbi:MAG TPA: (d)CMP kinase [Gemmatimonadetes bacterium]|jgi:cytidylate kinase|nr:(d)CMP kinase [Gemmatimonadota bacterium]
MNKLAQPVVTLDGPAGSGKSTTAKEVARRLGFRHLDSGGLYRALTLALLEEGIPPAQWADLTDDDMNGLPVRVSSPGTEFVIEVAGRVVQAELRGPRVTAHVAFLASLPAARRRLLHLQHAAGEKGGLVADGRDMGSVVFPDADVKVYLVADLRERARRRLEETGVIPKNSDVERESKIIEERDRQDSQRELSPLREPPNAHLIDTTSLNFNEQVEEVVALVEALYVD